MDDVDIRPSSIHDPGVSLLDCVGLGRLVPSVRCHWRRAGSLGALFSFSPCLSSHIAQVTVSITVGKMCLLACVVLFFM